MENDYNIVKQLHTIDKLLKAANQCGLQTEVVLFALKYMKEDPTLDPSTAMQLGYEEWMK